jgi:hypothetical protein
MALVDELLGTRHACTPYVPGQSQHHFDLLREADEFRAAANLYPDEEEYLLDLAFHRYQSILDMAVHHLKLPCDHLAGSHVQYKPYTSMAESYGWGTQAFTSEVAKPDVIISELSFADVGLLQLLLVHEMQHATDFAFYQGLDMSIIERELRARVSVAQALRGVQQEWPMLYQQSMLDEAYWLLLTYWLPDWNEARRAPYWELLEDEAKARLQAGLYFSPAHLRALAPELKRAEIDIDSRHIYWLERHHDAWEVQMRLLETTWSAAATETAEEEDGSQRNSIGEWHLYGSLLQEQAAKAQDPGGTTLKQQANGTWNWTGGNYAVQAGADTESEDVINTLRSFLGG